MTTQLLHPITRREKDLEILFGLFPRSAGRENQHWWKIPQTNGQALSSFQQVKESI